MACNTFSAPAPGLLLLLLLLGCSQLTHASAHTKTDSALPHHLETNHSAPLNQTHNSTKPGNSTPDTAHPDGRPHNQTSTAGPWNHTSSDHSTSKPWGHGRNKTAPWNATEEGKTHDNTEIPSLVDPVVGEEGGLRDPQAERPDGLKRGGSGGSGEHSGAGDLGGQLPGSFPGERPRHGGPRVRQLLRLW